LGAGLWGEVPFDAPIGERGLFGNLGGGVVEVLGQVEEFLAQLVLGIAEWVTCGVLSTDLGGFTGQHVDKRDIKSRNWGEALLDIHRRDSKNRQVGEMAGAGEKGTPM
jgi:hypothetical protein